MTVIYRWKKNARADLISFILLLNFSMSFHIKDTEKPPTQLIIIAERRQVNDAGFSFICSQCQASSWALGGR